MEDLFVLLDLDLFLGMAFHMCNVVFNVCQTHHQSSVSDEDHLGLKLSWNKKERTQHIWKPMKTKNTAKKLAINYIDSSAFRAKQQQKEKWSTAIVTVPFISYIE